MKIRRFRNDRWCSCERSIEVNGRTLLARVAFEKSAAQSEEGIGDVGNSAFWRGSTAKWSNIRRIMMHRS